MSIQANKRVVEDLYSEVYGRADFSRLDDLVSPEFVNTDVNAGQQSGRDGIPFIVQLLHEAFEGFGCTVEELIAEGDNVVAHVTFRGIHRREFLGVPPTGKPNVTEILAIWRFREGRIVGLHALRRLSTGHVH
jgi:predicted ester cyclase